MATGSTGGFSGEWNDLENIPNLISGNEVEELKNTRLAQLNDIAELRAAQSMNVDNYDNLFVDAFVDQSKIASSSNVNISTGTNGDVQLPQGTVIDDFEDGNTNQWGNNNLTATTTNPISGDYSGKKVSTDGDASIDFSDFTKDFQFKIRLDKDSGNSSDFHRTQIEEEPFGNVIYNIAFEQGNGQLIEKGSGTTLLSSWSPDTVYKIKIDPDFGSLQGDIYVNGQLKASNVPFKDGGSEIGSLIITDLTSNSGNTITTYIDDLKKGSQYDASGTLKSTSKTVSSSPDTVQVYQDAQLNGQDIDYVVKDGNGNTETITQSQVGESVNVSFTGTSMTTEIQFSGDGSNTPVLNEYGVDY